MYLRGYHNGSWTNVDTVTIICMYEVRAVLCGVGLDAQLLTGGVNTYQDCIQDS